MSSDDSTRIQRADESSVNYSEVGGGSSDIRDESIADACVHHGAGQTRGGTGHYRLDRSADRSSGVHDRTVAFDYHERSIYPEILQCFIDRVDEVNDRRDQTRIDNRCVRPLLESQFRCKIVCTDHRDPQHPLRQGFNRFLMRWIPDAHVTYYGKHVDLSSHGFHGLLGLFHVELLHSPALQVQLCIEICVLRDPDRMSELLSQDNQSDTAALPFDYGVRRQC